MMEYVVVLRVATGNWAAFRRHLEVYEDADVDLWLVKPVEQDQSTGGE
jgi:hypothetical protein